MSTRVDALEASIQDIINGDVSVSVPQSPSPGTPATIRWKVEETWYVTILYFFDTVGILECIKYSECPLGIRSCYKKRQNFSQGLGSIYVVVTSTLAFNASKVDKWQLAAVRRPLVSLDSTPLSLLNHFMDLGRLSLTDTFHLNHGVCDFTPGNGKETRRVLVWLTKLWSGIMRVI